MLLFFKESGYFPILFFDKTIKTILKIGKNNRSVGIDKIPYPAKMDIYRLWQVGPSQEILKWWSKNNSQWYLLSELHIQFWFIRDGEQSADWKTCWIS